MKSTLLATMLPAVSAATNQTSGFIKADPMVSVVFTTTVTGATSPMATATLQYSVAVPPEGADVGNDLATQWQPPAASWQTANDPNGTPISQAITGNGGTTLANTVPSFPFLRIAYTYASGTGGLVQVDVFAQGYV